MNKYIRIEGIPGIHKVVADLDKGEQGRWYKTAAGKWYPASQCTLTAETKASVEAWTLRHNGGD